MERRKTLFCDISIPGSTVQEATTARVLFSSPDYNIDDLKLPSQLFLKVQLVFSLTQLRIIMDGTSLRCPIAAFDRKCKNRLEKFVQNIITVRSAKENGGMKQRKKLSKESVGRQVLWKEKIVVLMPREGFN